MLEMNEFQLPTASSIIWSPNEKSEKENLVLALRNG